MLQELCWWPTRVDQLGMTPCGAVGTEMRTHPLCGCVTMMCAEHAADFDEAMADVDLSTLP